MRKIILVVPAFIVMACGLTTRPLPQKAHSTATSQPTPLATPNSPSTGQLEYADSIFQFLGEGIFQRPGDE